MKVYLRFLSALVVMTAFALTTNAQLVNCGIAPAAAGTIVAPPSGTDLAVGASTGPAALSGYAGGLPNLEFAAVNPNDILTDSSGISGARFLDANATGVFNPADYGLGDGDQIGIVAVSYDLAAVRNATDDLLNGSFLFTPCCLLIQTFVPDLGDICGALNAAGIFGPGDVNNVNDVFGLVAALGGTESFESLAATIDLEINPLVTSGTPCTGGNLICTTASPSLVYNIGGGAADCSAATTGLASTITGSGVQLSWTSNAATGVQAYRVCGRPVGARGFACLPPVFEPNTSSNVPAGVLISGATYEWKVQATCTPLGVTLAPESALANFTWPSPRQGAPEIDVEIGPNPTTEHLRISGLTGAAYQIMDATGRVVLQGELSSASDNWIGVDDLNAGFYILQMESDAGPISREFTVIR